MLRIRYLMSRTSVTLNFKDKESFLEEMSLIIDDCLANGSTKINVVVEANESDRTSGYMPQYTCEECDEEED